MVLPFLFEHIGDIWAELVQELLNDMLADIYERYSTECPQIYRKSVLQLLKYLL